MAVNTGRPVRTQPSVCAPVSVCQALSYRRSVGIDTRLGLKHGEVLSHVMSVVRSEAFDIMYVWMAGLIQCAQPILSSRAPVSKRIRSTGGHKGRLSSTHTAEGSPQLKDLPNLHDVK